MLKLTENIEIEIINLILPVIYILIGIVVYKILKRIIDRSINIERLLKMQGSFIG